MGELSLIDHFPETIDDYDFWTTLIALHSETFHDDLSFMIATAIITTKIRFTIEKKVILKKLSPKLSGRPI